MAIHSKTTTPTLHTLSQASAQGHRPLVLAAGPLLLPSHKHSLSPDPTAGPFLRLPVHLHPPDPPAQPRTCARIKEHEKGRTPY